MGNPNVYTCIDDFKDHLYDEIKGKEGPGGKFSNLYPFYKIESSALWVVDTYYNFCKAQLCYLIRSPN